uniref:Uncharacterized protein n=1 Tax=Leersia perrieri TaxID=77586 RepID=A0A0D9WH06_9ORYZ
MAQPRPLFDLNELPPEDDIAFAFDDAQAMACDSSRSPLDVAGGAGDGSTARGSPSPPPQEDDSVSEGEPLLPVFDLDAPLSPLDDDDEDEEEADLPRSQPHDDPDNGRSPGQSHSSERLPSDRSTACHAATDVDMRGASPVHDSLHHGGRTSPRTCTSLPNGHDTKTTRSPPAFPVMSSSETSASRVHGGGLGDRGTPSSSSYMPRRQNPPPVPRDAYGEDSGTSKGGSRREQSIRSRPHALHGRGTPHGNRRRRQRPMQKGYNGHDQRQLGAYNGHDQRQNVYSGDDQRRRVNNYHDQRQVVYNNGQDQQQQGNNGRDQRQQKGYNNSRDQKQQQAYNTNGRNQKQQVYNNGQDQRRQGNHGHRRPEDYQDRQGKQHYGYSSGRPYAGEDSYGGDRQIPARQQLSNGGGYQPHRQPSGQQRRHVKPYHPYARDADAAGDRANYSGKQARHEHPGQQHQHQAYQQHRRNTGNTAGEPVRGRQY